MNKPKPPPLPPASSPDVKLTRAIAYLNLAAKLAKEAGVPAVANMADQAARLAGMSRIEEDEMSTRETVRRIQSAPVPDFDDDGLVLRPRGKAGG